MARLVVEGALSGRHRSSSRGFNVEFSEHRQYMPGDELRHLDWKLYAKSGKFYVKQYEENTTLRCMLMLDCSGSMGYSGGGRPSKLYHAKVLCAAMAYLALHQQDAAGIATFSSSLDVMVPPRMHLTHLRRIVEALEGCEAGGEADFFEALRRFASEMRRRALVVVISDFLDDTGSLLRALRYLKYLKHDVVLFQVLDPWEVDFPFEGMCRFHDLETGDKMTVDAISAAGEYRRLIAAHLGDFAAACSSCGIDRVLCLTDRPVVDAMASFLHRRAGRGGG